jgi:hypothetical protein
LTYIVANMPSEDHRQRTRQLVVTGTDRSQTLSALGLAVGLGVGAALLRIYAPSTPGIGLEFGLLHAFTLEASPAAIPIEGFGVVTMFTLAGIHAYLNEGYVPSLLLAAAPSYGQYVFNGPGAAPLWAAEYVLPFAVTAGTLGFLAGIAFRWCRGKRRISPFGQTEPR